MSKMFNQLLRKNKSNQSAVSESEIENSELESFLEECKSKLNNPDIGLITKAYNVSRQAHERVVRKSHEPYYKHCLEVARIVVNEISLDDISVAGALLHDVLDYGDGYSIKDISKIFGKEVAEIVDGVSKIGHIENSAIGTAIEVENYHKLLISLFKDVRIILIKLADRLHNMRTLDYLPLERQKIIARETLDIYSPIAYRIGIGNMKWELEDHAFKYLYRDLYDEISESLHGTRREREDYIKRFISKIDERLKNDAIIKTTNTKFKISGRPKHIYSIYNKMVNRNVKLEDMYDLFAVRIILDTDDPNLCFYVYGVVCDVYNPVPGTFKNYIYLPKKNGYKSIHTAVIGNEDKNVEVQIRTRKMHDFAEKGLAAHFVYKSRNLAVEEVLEEQKVKEWVKTVREIFESSQNLTPKELIESVNRNLFFEEIYVFTPTKELRRLPRDSSALDFAYHIHSEIGNHCIGAKVNGKIVPIDYRLKNGEIVEILTSTKEMVESNWLNYVVTTHAKYAISKSLKEKNKKLNSDGKKIWYHELKNRGITISDEDFKIVISSLRFQNEAEFYTTLAKSDIDVSRAIEFITYKLAEIKGNKTENQNGNNALNDKKNKQDLKKDPAAKAVEDVRINVNYAECCYPIPGDSIIGLIHDINKIVVHRRNCSLVQELFKVQSKNLMELSWDSIEWDDLTIEIYIAAEDRDGLINDITNLIIDNPDYNIKGIQFDVIENIFSCSLTISSPKPQLFGKLMKDLSKIEGVKAVDRKSTSESN